MSGQKGLTIAVVALLITLAFGFLGNIEEKPSTRTVYNDEVNLEPLFYSNSSRGSGVEFYNSIYNVTGWDNATIEETNIANQYRLPSIATYVDNPAVNYDLNTYTHTTGALIRSNPGGWETTTAGVFYLNGDRYTNGEFITGGLGGSSFITVQGHTYASGLGYSLNGTDYPASMQVAFKSINDLITITDKIKVTNNGYYFNVSISETSQTTEIDRDNTLSTTRVAITAQLNDNCAYIIWDDTLLKWELYNSSNVQIGTSPNAYIIKTETFTGSISSQHLDTALPRYADPNRLVTIGNSENTADYAKWSNTARDDTLINARVAIVLTGNLDLYPISTNDTVIQIRNTGGNYTITIGTGEGATVHNIGAYSGLYVLMDAQTNTLTVNGVLSFSTQAPAVQYELTPFTYSVNYAFSSTQIKAIFVNGMATGNAYIANTWVYSDPSGILWNDFNLNLESYFKDRITNHGVRFSINGITYFGSSLTINNKTFTVTEDNKITYTVTEGIHDVEYTKPLNGLNVDYNNGVVILRFSDGSSYDTGTIVNYNLIGAGAWYFSTNLYTIDNIQSKDINWVVGWSLDKNLTCLIYLGAMAGVFMLASYYGRGTIGGLDYLIMGLAGLIAFMLMV